MKQLFCVWNGPVCNFSFLFFLFDDDFPLVESWSAVGTLSRCGKLYLLTG